jgi:hypothetical protein
MTLSELANQSTRREMLRASLKLAVAGPAAAKALLAQTRGPIANPQVAAMKDLSTQIVLISTPGSSQVQPILFTYKLRTATDWLEIQGNEKSKPEQRLVIIHRFNYGTGGYEEHKHPYRKYEKVDMRNSKGELPNGEEASAQQFGDAFNRVSTLKPDVSSFQIQVRFALNLPQPTEPYRLTLQGPDKPEPKQQQPRPPQKELPLALMANTGNRVPASGAILL